MDAPASEAFLEQLREYTRGFRIDNSGAEEARDGDRERHDAPSTHLGVRF